jgi:CheY-like chemotaxis protein/HPt (histidine-containing phosphotransfer) domain-containing protein
VQQPIITRHAIHELTNLFADRKGRILIAEDNITNLQVAAGILKKLGLHADAVSTGQEVLTALKTIPYDLILMDMNMPEMDGLEATRLIRSQCALHPLSAPDIPIIAMTANALQGDRARCLESGMNDYITKPVSPESLANALKKWLPQDKNAGNPSTPSASIIFDKESLLARLMNDENLARNVVECFVKDLPKQITALNSYLELDDAISTVRQAHTIKSAAANVGGTALTAVAAIMEKVAKTGNLKAVKARLPELENEFDQLRTMISKELKQP